jgi:transcriptional regulator with XRE-family HTH domain
MNLIMFSQQVRMARAILNWSIRELAANADLSPDTVIRAEKGDPSVKAAAWGALQITFETEGIEFIENGTILPHTDDFELAFAASPDMPRGIRRIYPEMRIAYVVSYDEQTTVHYDSHEAQQEIKRHLGENEISESNFSKDEKPKYVTYRSSNSDDTATLTYFRYDLPQKFEEHLKSKVLNKPV